MSSGPGLASAEGGVSSLIRVILLACRMTLRTSSTFLPWHTGHGEGGARPA